MTPGQAMRWRVAAWAFLGVVIVAGLGGAATDLGAWYRGLRQPAWKPPDAWFGPIWTTIYVFVIASIVLTWGAADAALRRQLLGLWLANGVLNVLWSMLFFTWKRPDWALFEVGLLWLSTLVLVVASARVSRIGAALLVSYLAWVCVAAKLNFDVVALNGPFGGA